MGIDLSLESKSNLDLSLEAKDDTITWDEADFTWDDATGTWERPGRNLETETKSAVSLSLESK